MAASVEQYKEPLAGGERCDERLSLITRVLNYLRQSRLDVFGIPVAAALSANYSGGDAALHPIRPRRRDPPESHTAGSFGRGRINLDQLPGPSHLQPDGHVSVSIPAD